MKVSQNSQTTLDPPLKYPLGIIFSFLKNSQVRPLHKSHSCYLKQKLQLKTLYVKFCDVPSQKANEIRLPHCPPCSPTTSLASFLEYTGLIGSTVPTPLSHRSTRFSSVFLLVTTTQPSPHCSPHYHPITQSPHHPPPKLLKRGSSTDDLQVTKCQRHSAVFTFADLLVAFGIVGSLLLPGSLPGQI